MVACVRLLRCVMRPVKGTGRLGVGFAAPVGWIVMAKIGRNTPCHCGSGKKYKHCHGKLAVRLAADLDFVTRRHQAEEKIRKAQQGRGRPIVAAKMNDQQMVAVGDTVYFSKTWKAFPDFLSDYLKTKLDPAWGNAEISKPLADRHPLMQWYEAYCLYQKQTIKVQGEIAEAPITGVVACYLGLAYSLYLLDHNVVLQSRLINRLKNIGNFQGAYYELIVASILIRSGFTLTLEDETDGLAKHCEFAAISGVTGKRYWVEAKMRSVSGLLGRTAADGGSDDDAMSRLIPHLNGALAKPAADERLIFIDVNAPSRFDREGKPDWLEAAMSRLERYEKRELQDRVTAYIFVTNFAFHRQLDTIPTVAAAPFGLGHLDFNRAGVIRVSEAYRQKQKHIDAHILGETLVKYLDFPITFDGSLPSEAFGRGNRRAIIGQTYCFENVDGNDLVGTVTAAMVDEVKRQAVIAVTPLGAAGSRLLRAPMTDSEIAEYKKYGPAYFGDPRAGGKKLKDPLELFEWLMETQKNMSRVKLLAWFGGNPALPTLEKMSDDELRLAYCEALTASIDARSKAKRGRKQGPGTEEAPPTC
jgi:hypothetical protein